MWVSQRKQHSGFHWDKDAVRHPAPGSQVSAAPSTGNSMYGSIYVQQVFNNSFVTKAWSCPLENISSRMEQGLTLQSNTVDSSGKKDPLLTVKCCSSALSKQSRKACCNREAWDWREKWCLFLLNSLLHCLSVIQSTPALLKPAQNLSSSCQAINTSESISLSTRAWHEKKMECIVSYGLCLITLSCYTPKTCL